MSLPPKKEILTSSLEDQLVPRETNYLETASQEKTTRPLGRGLDNLLGSKFRGAKSTKEGLSILPLTNLKPGKYQPRTTFSGKNLDELIASIKENGVLQPILVRPIKEKTGPETYEIIAGERRWRASKQAGRHTIPVVIRHLTNKQALESGLIENIQRDDLNVIEEGNGYQRLMDDFQYTQEAISKIIGKSRSHIANILRLLTLNNHVKNFLIQGDISVGHAKILIACDKADDFANLIVKEGLSVRQTEKLVSHYNKEPFDLINFENYLDSSISKNHDKDQNDRSDSKSKSRQKLQNKDDAPASDDIKSLEDELNLAIGLSSKIFMGKDQSGSVQIKFKTPQELDRLLGLIFGTL